MYIGERERCIKDFVRKPEGKRLLGRPRRRWDKILRWTFRKWDGGEVWTVLIWLRIRTGGGHL